MHLLVRAQHNRQGAHPQKHLWDWLGTQRVSARLKIQVPRPDGQPGRRATLSIRFTQVTLRPPCLKEDQAPLTLCAVEARAPRPPKGAPPLCWRLLTTLPVASAAAAVGKVRWPAQRRVIEVLHKELKSGCQIEQRPLESAARLQRVLIVDVIVAWRVLALCRGGAGDAGGTGQRLVAGRRVAGAVVLGAGAGPAAATGAERAGGRALERATGGLAGAAG